MKIENRYVYSAYDYLLITDFATDSKHPWVNSIFQTTSDAIPFYDYVNYYLTATGTSGDTYNVTLNGNDQTVSGLTLHVPNLQSTGNNQSPQIINQMWFMVDAADIQLQASVHGSNLYQLTKDQTQLTPTTSPPNGYTETPVYSYGTDFIPTLDLTNTGAATVASTEANQGILVFGNRYPLTQIDDDVMAEQIYTTRRFSSVTVVPPRI